MNKDEIKSQIEDILNSYNLDKGFIDRFVSDEFINGMYTLIQQEPQNNDFLIFIRSLSNEQNLVTIENIRYRIISELGYNSYFSDICKYITANWKVAELNEKNLSVALLKDSSDEISQEDIDRGKYIIGAGLKIIRAAPAATAALNDTALWSKLVIAVHEWYMGMYDKAENYFNSFFKPNCRKDMYDKFSSAGEQASPLVIDLDGDGTVETNKENSTVHFDHDNNGFAESTGWVGKDDGLLVRDINGNGQIDNGTELFGNNSVLSSGEKAANGFEALADLDSNNDGVFNSSDTAWDDVKVWKDSNGNGIVDEGELLTLTQAGVSGINLDYQDSTTTDENGNQHNQTGTFIKADGTTGSIHDVWFDADYADTVNKVEITIPDNIKDMPNISGFGNVCSLQEAMAQDESGELKALIEQYMTETNAAVRKGMIDKIIFHWTGVQDIDPLSRKPSYFADGNNPLEDARYLEALERFLGEKYSNRYWFGREDQNPHEQAAKYLLQGYDILAAYVSNELEAQTHCKTLLENIKLTWNEETQVWDIDISGAVNILNSLAETNLDSAIATLHFLEDIIEQQNMMVDAINTAFQNQATETNNLQEYYLNFGKLENKISNGSDIIYGTDDDNYINGLAGNDKIYGENGNDTLIGGTGNDYLVGGNGSDTYFFEGSWGKDSIDNSSTDEKGTNPDKILFGEGISPSDVTILRRANDLILSLHNGADTVTVYGYFLEAGTTTNTVDTIEFADGTVWDYEHVRVAWNAAPVSVGGFVTISGTNGNDKISGTSGGDFLSGEKGDDTINANAGNDVIYGGAGNDKLNGGAGDDTYIWNLGDGLDTIYDAGNNDTISFGDGISFSDLAFQCVNNSDLKIFIKNNPNQGIIIQDFLTSNLNYKIEELTFIDGSQVHLSEIALTLKQLSTGETITGTDFGDTIYANGGNDTVNAGNGNDTIYGGAGFDTIKGENGNDILIGGTGNDRLEGGAGDDTYIYNIGDGLDTIYDYQGSSTEGKNDKIKFGEGITPSDTIFSRKGDNLVITLFNDISQGIIIQDFFSNEHYQVEKLEFIDGTITDLITGLTLQQSDGHDKVSGTSYDDIIYGNRGNDTINGESGNDILIGGKGNDNLSGGNGNDTYIWNFGDGFDRVTDTAGNNIIQFGEGITLENLTFERSNENDSTNGNDLYIFVNGDRNQGINLYNFFGSTAYQNFSLKFADGSTFIPKDSGFDFALPEGQIVLDGYSHADTLTGNSQDNTINGSSGNDILIGGRGNDILKGGNDNDTYVWNFGDGFDYISDSSGNNIIEFGEGIALENLTFERSNKNDSTNGNDLYIFVNGDRNQGVQICNFFGSPSYRNFTLKFSDGSTFVPKDNGFTLALPEGQTVLDGYSYADILTGNSQDNTINGNNGDDVLIGGKGNDTLKGGNGNDIYIWNQDDGFDYLSDASGTNVIQFGEGISLENLTFERSSENDSTNGDDLYIFVNGDRNQGMQICNFFGSPSYRNFTLKFADGTTQALSTDLPLSQLPEVNLTLNGTADDDILTGGIGNDIINTGDGYNDITGGQGNDTITGGYDRDTYYYNLGDGFDTIIDPNGKDQIIFGEGISKDDLRFRRNGNDLWLIINNDLAQGMKLVNFFASDDNKIETLKFADNSSVNLATAGLTLDQWDTDDNITGTSYDDVIYGNNGKDTLSGGSGKDILIGGHGNDTLYGGAGNDTYRWNSGDGFDTIEDNSGQNSVEFGDGIDFDDLTFTKIGENLYITINNNPTEGLNLSKFFNNDSYKNFTLKFKDGTQHILNENGLTFSQGDTFDTINGTNFNDVIYANDGNDTVNALAGNDTVYGGKGNDIIDAGNGNDTLVGGEGNDTLAGGVGDDTYIYNLGDGFDTISDTDGTDKIVLGTGITADMLSFSREGNDLRIIINNDKLQGFLLKNQFAAGTSKIESIEFADESTLSLINKGFTLNQNNIDETISGTDFNDTINAAAGNDTVNAGEGDDTITGGLGNDNLNGGNGDDTYIYNMGDGFDTITETSGADKIVLGTGIALENLRFIREGNNLRILINNNVDQGFLLVNQFAGADTRIEQLQFADNSVLDLVNDSLTFEQYNGGETINGTDNDDTIYGRGGNDTIDAGDGDDTIVGGIGDDTLSGGYGRDTYIYNLGDGADTINETRGNDIIKFGAGITQDDLTFTQEGNNLKILIDNDPYQSILINNFYSNVNNQVEKLQFADGSTFNLSTQGLTLTQNNGDETINGTGYNDVIYGNGGHDTINAGEGNDTIVGGIGNDILNGGNGDDTYIYNLGDGFDTITESGGNDKIVFGEGISQSDLSFEKIGNDLKISINGNEVKGIQINDHFRYDSSKVETIEFHDGSTLDISNADQLIQAMNSFSVSNSASTDTLSNPTEDVSDMYSLAASQDLTRKAI